MKKIFKSKTIIFTLLLGVAVSFFAACKAVIFPAGFAATAIATAIAIFIAVFTEIQNHKSTINRHLLPTFYTYMSYWFFLIYQGFIALSAIIIEHTHVYKNSASPYTRILLGLVVFDFFYYAIYRSYLSPVSHEVLLDRYVKIIQKKIKKGVRQGNVDSFSPDIWNIGRIGTETNTSHDKEFVLNALDALLTKIASVSIPITEINSHWNHTQLTAWGTVVECIRQSCTVTTDPHTAGEKNIMDALSILDGAWQTIINTEKRSDRYEDYKICTQTIKELALFAIKKDYHNCVAEATQILHGIAEAGIDKPSKAFVSPSEIAYNLKEIGVAAAQAGSGNDDLTTAIIIYLLSLFANPADLRQQVDDESLLEDRLGQNKMYLFDVISLMAHVWDNNNDTLSNLLQLLTTIDDNEITETISHGAQFFTVEAAQIKRFFGAVENYKKESLEKTSNK